MKKLICIFGLCWLSVALGFAQDWIPDTNLRQVISEHLEIPKDQLTIVDMEHLKGFNGRKRGITDLAGMEYAIHLQWANLGENEIQDLSPLAKLVELEDLWIYVNPISNLSPLANLVNLKKLDLGGCRISDLRPLANLTGLEYLQLQYNQIQDITPLANLTNLTNLSLIGNRILDVSPLEHLSLSEFAFDEVCAMDRLPTRERIHSRHYPSAFHPWYDILNRPSLSPQARIASHDLSIAGDFDFGIYFRHTDQGVVFSGDLDQARQKRDELLAMNPNLIFITSVFMRDSYVSKLYPQDSPHWLRDATGTPVEGWPGTLLLDFTHPAVQEVIVSQARAVSRCGLYDGIFLDWWREDITVLDGYRSNAAEQHARDVIIRRIREAIGEDFLILVNANRTKPQRAAPYINGLYIETVRDSAGGYTYQGLREIESTLLWAEERLRTPQITCLEGWSIATLTPDPALDYRAIRVVDTKPDTPVNQRWMRLFTALSLTHSNGYVHFYGGYLYASPEKRTHRYGFWDADAGQPIGEPQQHYWYDFWDADLGEPVGEKAERYRNQDGLFIREFTNGWTVYNRSGKPQDIQLPEKVNGWASGIENKRWHTLADLDGEIYLKRFIGKVDVNGDRVVNVLDLVIVANNFGSGSPVADVNGDRVVNVLDLVIVANNFGE